MPAPQSEAETPKNSSASLAADACPICKGTHYYVKDVPMGHADFGKAIPCPCQAEARRIKQQARLLALDGLTDIERAYRFETLNRSQGANAIDAVSAAVAAKRGLITLIGAPGVGKTTILICAVNAGREQGQMSIYTTVTDLLSYLRSTFAPDSEDSFDRYWDALINCEILALDEFDEFNTTAWAMERFLRLIDERWRRMDEVLTLCASNARLQSLPGKIQSRLRDGRAQIIGVEGRDLRPINQWE